MKLRFWSSLAFGLSTALSAQVSLPRILSSHMVVQRDLPVHVWGKAAPGESVSVRFRGESRKTNAGPLGRWSLYLAPGAAGGPFEMTVESKHPGNAVAQTITLDDVLVGDVWVASGQSNMEFPMSDAATASQDIPKAFIPNLRLFVVQRQAVDYPQDDVESDGWNASTPNSVGNFSAVAWYFAREIGAREHVPVGIINSSWGGTPAEAWTRMGALAADAALMPVFASWDKWAARESDSVFLRKEKPHLIAEAKAQGRPAPEFPWLPQLESQSPALLYNGMIAPLTPFPIRGVIWYQGEGNTDSDRAPLYGRLFRAMIEDWRRQWGIGDFPFLFVQIANYKAGSIEDWPTLRQQQFESLELRNTGMAVTVDIGDPENIHPTDKLDVGLRLSYWARAISYGENVEVSGPLFRQAVPEGSSIRVWFDHSGKLVIKNGDLVSFEVAGIDGKFVPATAAIENNTVVVSSPSVTEPVYVRYGWSDNPQCNLFNGAGLPASPFTSAR
ncbi:MAG TPA: sialate O-acetylesterase [Alloacidobacterium sp.]|nr:sialate O-acetylesterase [Alloacidobacterium sp.]